MCQAVAGRVESITGEGVQRRAVVSVSDARREVSLALVPHVTVGDRVIFHSGYALRRVAESEVEALVDLLEGRGQ